MSKQFGRNKIVETLAIVVFSIITAIAVFIFAVVFTWLHNNPSIISPDRERIVGFENTFYDICNLTGRRFNTIKEYENSEYYPYIEELTNTYSRARLQVNIRNRSRNFIFEYKFYSNNKLKIFRDIAPYPDNINKVDLTKKMLLEYTTGINQRLRQINKIRDDTININDFAAKRYSQITHGRLKNIFTYKNLNVISNPIEHDLPTNDNELKKFVSWQCLIEGEKQLLDAWERPIIFKLKNGYIIAASAGPDSRYFNKDSLVVKRKIVSNN